ncbi:S8 family serine peptidase (plasmid) [Deinococcus sp. KNUC1210]|uniref:S8 family serine peptidase n=1 Tax=Deinococcus sp. KNUC1210 TaxID=2917691 RepID=UPI001EF0402D|nr:S8 family serine peptidase [Deinococcus sp. KNUC1210]ULH13918.1 S8 family serine peptidase [Deinococcus sp. KNUC1210]
MKKPLSTLLGCIGTALLLGACGQTSTPTAQTVRQAAPTQIVTVMKPGTATDQQLEALYGGHLITRTDTFALIGRTGNAPALPLQTLGTSNTYVAEQNTGVITAPEKISANGLGVWGDSLGVWGDGLGVWGDGLGVWGDGLGVWGDGLGVWGDGTYNVIPANTSPWQQIGLEQAQNTATTLGRNVTIAVLDTGIDLTHTAFGGTLTPSSTWKDYVDGDATPQDEGVVGVGLAGHGTEVAGIALQIAPGAKIMPVRVLDSDGTGNVDDVVSGIVWAVQHGASIINLSLGADISMTAVNQAIAYANSQNVLVVGAAGNKGNEGLDYPAADFASPLDISVGSVSGQRLKSGFSQYGSSLNVLAPGERIYGPVPANRMGAWSGTSMSTPVVSGALALGLSQQATATRAAAALRASAGSLDATNPLYQGKLGTGQIDLAAFTDQLK